LFSRGGVTVKLAGRCCSKYPIDIADHVCLDIGASTGGFTRSCSQRRQSGVSTMSDASNASLAARPVPKSFDEETISELEGKRLPSGRTSSSSPSVSLRLKAVMPVDAWSLAAAHDASAGIIKPNSRRRVKAFQARIFRNAMVLHQEICDDIAGFVCVRSDHRHPGISVSDQGGDGRQNQFFIGGAPCVEHRHR